MHDELDRRVLSVMAHPDDSEILVGGTLLLLHAAGWKVGIVTMTAGDCGSMTHTKEEITRIRRREAEEAADLLDAWYRCAGLQDLEIFANASNQRRVVELMRRFRPDLVLTHSPADYLVDHEETARLTRSAAFAAGAPLYRTGEVPPAESLDATPALYYADPVEGVDAMGRRVSPQFYVDVGERIDEKAELLARHASQREWLRAYHGMDRYIEQMKEYARSYGEECGAEYAEGFRQHRGHGYPREPRLQDALESAVRDGRAPHDLDRH